MFNRSVRYLVEGIKPVYVFDGKPPSLKSGELLKRREKRQKAEEELKKAKESGDADAENQQQKRLVRAGTKENDDCKKLLRLMGLPVVEAPCEAEAQCASLCKEGKVYASATEDMDCLTFATPVLLRKMTFANSGKAEIQVLNYAKAIEGLNLTHDEFVDLCILLGCDYCDSIKGIGPVSALKLIREHKNIETILKHLNRDKYDIPANWLRGEKKSKKAKDDTTTTTSTTTETASTAAVDDNEKPAAATTAENTPETANAPAPAPSPASKVASEAEDDEDSDEPPVYVQARRLFNKHECLTGPDVTLKWKEPDGPELTKFLCDEMGFDPKRVASGIEKLRNAFKKNSKPQMRMDSFFGVKKAPNADALAKKREAEKKNKKKGGAKKQKKTGFFSKR
jgi:flap endonuclease-1